MLLACCPPADTQCVSRCVRWALSPTPVGQGRVCWRVQQELLLSLSTSRMTECELLPQSCWGRTLGKLFQKSVLQAWQEVLFLCP